MKDVMGMMKQVQAMQAKMQTLQAELEQTEVEGVAGGGLVKVRLTAKGEMKGVDIDASLLKAEEKEIVEDLVLAAHNDARGRADRLTQEKMGSITAGLPLPPGMKLPF
ncbi:YbaB/EbfC family nucleoid-associated protein [Labrys sp. ZIDIC5]|uniref:YbaB/EbfC family nucleoid-associated protein n=1 Tax=Labrys sedimenti TaxID=3106036 RepID=UPI002AC9F588|nr:YbaB/EbfC family nucleoid-associated protein [Labrys sp. ZIDIC5]MDZ5452767.1 YbaB/EbfC family nucleoid-associated protein [Labrys sp. ZIDIC5]